MKYLSLTIPGYGQVDSNLPTGVPTGGLFGTGADTIRTLIIFVVTIAILFALYLVIQGGLDLITSQGHKEKIVKAREKIIYAVLGLIFIFLSFLMINAASALTGTKILSPFFNF